MAKTGRKSKAEELNIVERYAALSDKFFGVLSDFLENGTKADQKWAIEQLSKAYPRMIPQKIGGDESNQTPIPISILNGATTLYTIKPPKVNV